MSSSMTIMKACSKCKEEKPVSEFHRQTRSADGRHPYCKPCKAGYASDRHWRNRDVELERMRQWKQTNREHVLAKAKEWYEQNSEHKRDTDHLRIQEKRSLIRLLKARPCADCGGSFPPICMDFDHVGDDKVMNVSKMGRYSIERILEEIAKCEVVCANCHRLRTANRGQYTSADPEDLEVPGNV
jgi:hypothetical protein